MKAIIVISILIIIIVTLAIFYILSYSKLIETNIKLNIANENIEKALHKKHSLMNKLYTLIKKVVKKKDYLKDFNSLKNKKLNTYELDNNLSEFFDTMKQIKEDYKRLNTKEYNAILNEIKELDEEIIANKKYFNKNNNILIKQLKSYHKIVGKIHGIKVRNSYELKEVLKNL